jgi:hypothetical protein
LYPFLLKNRLLQGKHHEDIGNGAGNGRSKVPGNLHQRGFIPIVNPLSALLRRAGWAAGGPGGCRPSIFLLLSQL